MSERKKKVRWTAEETATLRRLYAAEHRTARECADIIGRSLGSVTGRIFYIGLKNPKNVWTAEEDAYIKKNYAKLTAAKIAEKLGRKVRAVYIRAWKIGATEGMRTNRKCTIYLSPEQQSMMRREFPHVRNALLASILGISERTVINKARKMGLRKSDEFMRECQAHTAACAKESHLRNGTFPKKGVVNDNLAKGAKFRFEKGHKPTLKQQS